MPLTSIKTSNLPTKIRLCVQLRKKGLSNNYSGAAHVMVEIKSNQFVLLIGINKIDIASHHETHKYTYN